MGRDAERIRAVVHELCCRLRARSHPELSERGIQEFCRDGVLPLMLNLVVDNCPRLFRDQREALGDLALQLSQRRNFGFFSLYTTEVGASGLLAQLPLPRYSLETLAVAGQFIVLRAESVE